MEFKKIQINGGGFKGMALEFYQEEEKGGRKQMVLTKKYPKNPVHLGLEKLFKDLRPHLLQICRIIHEDMDKTIMAQIINETSVNSIELGVDMLVLKGEQLATDSKYIGLKTYKIEQGDNYLEYEALVKIVDEICAETEEYMNGTKLVDEVECVIRYIESGKAKGVSLDDVKSLPPDKLKAWCSQVLESSFGSVVLHAEDVSPDLGAIDEAVEQLNTEFEVADGETEVILEKEEKKAKKSKKVETQEEEF
jgi:hypothetical protein